MELSEFRKAVSFFGTCPALSEVTLVSKRITTAFLSEEIQAHFPLNTNRLLELDFYISLDGQSPATGRPTGISFFQEYGQVNYITGDDETKRLKHTSLIQEAGSYLKVYARNNDTFEHTIDVQIMIKPYGQE